MQALEADLVRCGWQLSDVPHRLGWRALFAFLGNLPPDASYYRAIDPETAFWMGGSGVQNLLASVIDQLAVLVWQNTKDGHKGRKRPKPIKRPWSKTNTDRIGRGAIPKSEWADFWGDGS